MYGDWVSLSIAVHDREAETRSVLGRLPPQAGRTVVAAVVRGIASTLGIAAAPQPSPLSAAAEVDWCMEVGHSGRPRKLGSVTKILKIEIGKMIEKQDAPTPRLICINL